MSLAARCPACGTVFRVVQDQLRVSEGWVRCGRCGEVFNAIEGLVDLDALAAPPSAVPVRHGADRVLDDLAATSASTSPPPEAIDDPQAAAAVDHGPAPLASAARESTPIEADNTRDVAAMPSVDTDAILDLRAEPTVSVPAFVRQAERAARWRRPGIRTALAGTAALLAGLLGVQAGLEYRDLVAARWPATATWLAAACRPLQCRLEAPRSIDALAVESSGLVRIEGTAMYRLTLSLRNRAPYALMTPAVDLSATDGQGGLIARRVVAVAELGAARTIAAGSEVALQATFGATERAISGYTVELFYP